jgi:hypothetical protein
VSAQTGDTWNYIRVDQKVFGDGKFKTFKDLFDLILGFCRNFENTLDAAKSGLELADLEKRFGKTYRQIHDEYESKMINLTKLFKI